MKTWRKGSGKAGNGAFGYFMRGIMTSRLFGVHLGISKYTKDITGKKKKKKKKKKI
jgi:hypothetical protein